MKKQYIGSQEHFEDSINADIERDMELNLEINRQINEQFNEHINEMAQREFVLCKCGAHALPEDEFDEHGKIIGCDQCAEQEVELTDWEKKEAKKEYDGEQQFEAARGN